MITYPFPMPNAGAAECEFGIKHIDAVNKVIGGSVVADQIGPPYWEASIRTASLERRSARLADWTRFLDVLRGAKKVCLLFDPDMPYPRAYKNFDGLTRYGGGSFDGTSPVDVRVSAFTFEIGLLPVGFNIQHGDYVGFTKSGRYWLSRVVEGDVASLTGEATISVEPQVPPMFDAAAEVNFLRPYGEFIIMPDSIQRPRGLEGGTISFRAQSRVF